MSDAVAPRGRHGRRVLRAFRGPDPVEVASATLGLGEAAPPARAEDLRPVRISLMRVALASGACTVLPLASLLVVPHTGAAFAVDQLEVRSLMMLWAISAAAGAFATLRLAPHRRGSRLLGSAAVVAAGATLASGFAATMAGFTAARLLAGLASGVVAVCARPLVLQIAPPVARARALALHHGVEMAVLAAALGLSGAGVVAADLSWRGVLFYCGLVATVGAVIAVTLRAPASEPHAGTPDLSQGEQLRRVLSVRSVSPLLLASLGLGVMWLPLFDLTNRFLASSWLASEADRFRAMAALAVAGVAGLASLTARDDDRMRTGPGDVLRSSADLVFLSAVALVIAAGVNVYGISLAALDAGFAGLAVARVRVDSALLALVPAESRGQALALATAASLGGGTVLGYVGGLIMSDRHGWSWALALMAAAGVVAAGALQRAAHEAPIDVANRVSEEAAAVQRRLRPPTDEPLLTCRGIDFAYGQVQVLFGVDLTVRQGEMVALMGTNGAGKSTLLRVISGLGTPRAGSVRFDGQDVTFLDATRRVPLGISQVPGGKAVFGPLSVVDNLRLFGFSLGADRKRVDAGLDKAFDAFPRLAERRNQAAATLSGGEQQMLAVSKALILQPRLLLIDELSLGLAPKIVSELLEIVRGISAAGTAVVLVEQSVNVALSLVDHAYFMEKGEIRFDGPAKELLHRGDLLRSVFLEGASKGLQ